MFLLKLLMKVLLLPVMLVLFMLIKSYQMYFYSYILVNDQDEVFPR